MENYFGRCPSGLSFGRISFLIYINDLPNGLKTNVKLFPDDTSLFAIVKDKNESANALNNDLSLISKWAFKWKMFFNPDPHKTAQDVLFSRKKKVTAHPFISLNNIEVEKASYQRYLGLFLDEKLTFKHHNDNTLREVNTGIAVIKKLRHALTRKCLLTIYKVFLRPLIWKYHLW